MRRLSNRATGLPPADDRPESVPAAEVDAILQAGLDAAARGEDVRVATAAAHARFHPPGPTLDERAIARLDGEGWTPDRQRAFLRHLAATASVSHAARHVGLSRQSAYALRGRHPNSVFAILWNVAQTMGRRRLYDEAMERAVEGREEAIWYGGEQVGTRLVFNDRLLMFLLSREPEPPHPGIRQEDLEQLWPQLLSSVDVVLPPSLTPERIADMVERHERRG